MEDLVVQTLTWLRSELPGANLELCQDGENIRLALPAAPGADYSFTLYFSPNGQREIHAIPCNLPQSSLSGDYFFFRMGFESKNHLSPRELARFANATVRDLIHSETRIRQRRGLLLWSFRLERKLGEKWVQVSSCSALRGLSVLPIEGRKHIHSSPPISGGERQGSYTHKPV